MLFKLLIVLAIVSCRFYFEAGHSQIAAAYKPKPRRSDDSYYLDNQ